MQRKFQSYKNANIYKLPDVHGWYIFFSADEKKIEALIQTIKIFSEDTGIKIGI